MLAGESLQQLTDGRILPSIHQVVLAPDAAEPRISTPFLLFARPSAPLGPPAPAAAAAVTSEAFVLAKVRQTPSVTFDRMYHSDHNKRAAAGASGAGGTDPTGVPTSSAPAAGVTRQRIAAP